MNCTLSKTIPLIDTQATSEDEIKREMIGWKGTIPALSTALEEPQYKGRKAIERLQETTPISPDD